MKIIRIEDMTEFPDVRELTPEELKEAYRLARESFTAADLAEYCQEWTGVPMEDVVAELVARQRKLDEAGR